MNEQNFLQTIHDKANDLEINPLLLMAGIEGLYMFKDVPLNQINYGFLDSLILTVFALRIGDGFHNLAEENLSNNNQQLQLKAIEELTEMSDVAIAQSGNAFLQSFAKIIDGKSPIRRYHIKALEVAAIEIKRAQVIYQNESISTIMLGICQTDLKEVLTDAAFFA